MCMLMPYWQLLIFPLAGQPFDKGMFRLAGPGAGAGPAARPQWLVPSEKVILFQTLYFPEGRDIGMRLTSVKVSAS